jgi:hypothetical protein
VGRRASERGSNRQYLGLLGYRWLDYDLDFESGDETTASVAPQAAISGQAAANIEMLE